MKKDLESFGNPGVVRICVVHSKTKSVSHISRDTT
jgi:hypothetical protein